MSKETKKQPLFHLAARGFMNPKQAALIRIASVFIALIIGCIPIIITGNNPITAYGIIIQGSLSRKIYIRQTIEIAIPLLGCAIAIAPCFKMKFWNIGAEGQITMGAIAASYFGLFWADKMPKPVLLLAMAISAGIFGGIWALIPGFCKAKWNTNETLFTLMMNYVAIGFVSYLQGGPWEGRKGSQIIPMFKESARLPKLPGIGVHAGLIIVLMLVVFMWFYMQKTKHGYEIAVIGDSHNTARYAGMTVGHIMVRTMFLSGFISGLVGFMVVSGANYTLYSGVANGVGFTSITVAWLSQLNSYVMILISMILAILTKGSNTLQTRLKVPASISEIVTGVLLFCMLACEFFIRYRLVFREKDNGEEKK